MKKMNHLPIALFGILSFLASSCSSQHAENRTADPPRIIVAAATAVRADMVDTVRIFGTVHLRQEARLGSQFDGRLSDFVLLPGEHVRKGQRIGTIIPPAREALLQVLDNMPAEARPNLEQQIRTIPLLSPIDGVVLEVLRHTGDVVQKGEQIVHLGDLRVLDIRGDLPVRDLSLVRKAKKLTVTFVDYPHAPLSLPLEAISGQVNATNQTVQIRLKLDNRTGEFRPGMLVTLSFAGERHREAVVIPRQALLEEEGVFSVFVLQGTQVEKRLVTPGILQDKRVEIVTGVQEAERVVTEKAYSLEDGMEVEVKRE